VDLEKQLNTMASGFIKNWKNSKSVLFPSTQQSDTAGNVAPPGHKVLYHVKKSVVLEVY
jgi:hypothetical protein